MACGKAWVTRPASCMVKEGQGWDNDLASEGIHHNPITQAHKRNICSTHRWTDSGSNPIAILQNQKNVKRASQKKVQSEGVVEWRVILAKSPFAHGE